MTEIADDRSWWADVEHLRPGAAEAAGPAPGEPSGPPVAPGATGRRGRITGRPLPAEGATGSAAVLRRADAAAFADAMDLDGAFGAPARSREIILTGARGATPPGAGGAPGAPAGDESPAVPALLPATTGERTAGPPAPGRKTVRITGNPGIHAELAQRRALREIQAGGARRSRTPAQRAGHRPDRVAMWAVLLGLFLVIIAATSSSAGLA